MLNRIADADDEICVLMLQKGAERYIFTYCEHERRNILRAMGRMASNPELSFTWYDAAFLSQKVRAGATP